MSSIWCWWFRTKQRLLRHQHCWHRRPMPFRIVFEKCQNVWRIGDSIHEFYWSTAHCVHANMTLSLCSLRVCNFNIVQIFQVDEMSDDVQSVQVRQKLKWLQWNWFDLLNVQVIIIFERRSAIQKWRRSRISHQRQLSNVWRTNA